MTKYKTAKQLNLTAKEKKALVGVMGKLSRDELKHHIDFDMDKWACGNIHCIGGWADHLYKTDFNTKSYDDAIDKLFFARTSVIRHNEITPKQAAKAIQNFLVSGNPKWEKIT